MHVAIVALGPSSRDYLVHCEYYAGRHNFCDEVWTLNSLGGVIDCDLIVHMDDVRVQEARAEAGNEKIGRMLRQMKRPGPPILTSRVYADYPRLTEMPIENVINACGLPYFNTTAAWALGYAIYKEAKKISLYGMDFTYPNSNLAEQGRGCVEFWVRAAINRDIEVEIAPSSSLLDMCRPMADKLYGYDGVNVEIKLEDGKYRVYFSNKDLPSAADIERKYDHRGSSNE